MPRKTCPACPSNGKLQGQTAPSLKPSQSCPHHLLFAVPRSHWSNSHPRPALRDNRGTARPKPPPPPPPLPNLAHLRPTPTLLRNRRDSSSSVASFSASSRTREKCSGQPSPTAGCERSDPPASLRVPCPSTNGVHPCSDRFLAVALPVTPSLRGLELPLRSQARLCLSRTVRNIDQSVRIATAPRKLSSYS